MSRPWAKWQMNTCYLCGIYSKNKSSRDKNYFYKRWPFWKFIFWRGNSLARMRGHPLCVILYTKVVSHVSLYCQRILTREIRSSGFTVIFSVTLYTMLFVLSIWLCSNIFVNIVHACFKAPILTPIIDLLSPPTSNRFSSAPAHVWANTHKKTKKNMPSFLAPGANILIPWL